MLTVSLICLVMLLFIGFSFSFFGVRLISFFLLFFFLVHVFGMLFLGRGSTTGNEQILAIYSLSFFILVFFFYILLECSLRSRRGLGFLRFDEAGNVLFLLFTMVAVLGFSIYCFKSGGALDGDYNARIQKNAGSGYLIIMMYGYLSAISIGLVGGGVKSWTKILCLFCYSIFFGGMYYYLIGGSRNLIAASFLMFVVYLVSSKKIGKITAGFSALTLFIAILLLEYYRYALTLEGFSFSKGVLLFSESLSPYHAIENIYVWLEGRGSELQGLGTFLNEFAIVVPRFLWEDKPLNVVNNGYYYTTEILNLNTSLTISPTLMGSSLIMFGEFFLIFSVFCAFVIFVFDKMWLSSSLLLRSYAFCMLPYTFFMVRDGLEVFLYVAIKFMIIFLLIHFFRLFLESWRRVGSSA